MPQARHRVPHYVVTGVLCLAVVCLSTAALGEPEACRLYAPQWGQTNTVLKPPGYHWLERKGAVVSWMFDASKLAQCDPSRVHINFAGLLTDQFAGNSGQETELTFIIEIPSGSVYTQRIRTYNHFEPIAPTTRNIGYQVYGCGGALPPELVRNAVMRRALKVTLAWDSGMDPQHKAGVNIQAVSLGYVQ